MKGKVAKVVADALRELVARGVIPPEAVLEAAAVPVDLPKRPEHGDFATNVALTIARAAKKNPREIATALVEALGAAKDSPIASAEIAGPGFVNLRLHPSAWHGVLGDILADPAGFSKVDVGHGERVNCEFVSVNPTGPLHVGHGRGAVVGDALARLLTAAGYRVLTEYYVNDRGNQVKELGFSVALRYRELLGEAVEFPAEGNWYRGDYLIDVARALRERDGDVHRTRDVHDPLFRDFAIERLLAGIKADLASLRVDIQVFTSERALTDAGKVKDALATLEARGLSEKLPDGAVCMKAKELGDDKDRILVKRDGELTYFATDIAYHLDKIARGADRMINVWGADHHGYIPRMRGALKAFGYPPDKFEVLLIQIVHLYRGGDPVKMSKRSGDFVPLREVIDEVGCDACRFLLLLRRHDSHLDFDLELAKQKSLDNPVYYVQYGHARLCSLLRRAAEMGEAVPPFDPAVCAKLELPEELGIVRKLAAYPDTLREAAEAREPHRIVYYLTDLAQAFQSYYTQLWKVRNDPILPLKSARAGDWRAGWDVERMRARLLWIDAIRRVTKMGMDLLGVQAPERMEQRTDSTGKELEESP